MYVLLLLCQLPPLPIPVEFESTSVATAAEQDAARTPAAVVFSDQQTALLDAANALRPREASPELMAAAQEQADFIASHPCRLIGRTYDNAAFSHDTNGGSQVRVQKHGWSGHSEEVLAMRPVGWQADCWQMWRESPGHWQSVMSDNTHCGFGAATGADGCSYYVGLFGRKRPAVASGQAAGPAKRTAPAAFIPASCGPGGCGPAMQGRRAILPWRR